MNTLVHFNHVSLAIPDVEKPILSDITYSIYSNDIIILLGSNGSGKSSLLKLLDGRYHATEGEISTFFSSTSRATATLSQHCDDSLFTSLTVLENYILVKGSKHDAASYLSSFNINLPQKLNQIAGKLSGGEKQALALALCFIHPPQLLLLDEHTSALDPHAAQQLMELTHRKIIEYGITCLLTTHDLTMASQYGNRVLALKQGKMIHAIDDKRNDIISKDALLKECY